MFKFSPINAYALRNLQQNQIFFNNPLRFNDPFDTFHPAKITEISNEKFVDIYCKTIKRKFDKKILLGILENNISKKELYEFCDKHLDYFFDFKNTENNKVIKNKLQFLDYIENQEGSRDEFIDNIGGFFSQIKRHIEGSMVQTMNQIRKDLFSKIGVTCFSKNNLNLLMWSHYADSHQGFCLEFDPETEPFSQSFDVIYRSEIPSVVSDLLLDEKDNTESIKKLLSYKSSDWEHEEEIRLFHRESNKVYGYTPQSLKAIYFGIRTFSDIEIVCSIVKAQNPGVKFYRMKKQTEKFGIEAEEFVYNTVIEVQSGLKSIITNMFGNEEFSIEQLDEITTDRLTKIQIEAHIEDLIRKNVLTKKNNNYKLKN